MAIERFEEALKEYLEEEARKKRVPVVNSVAENVTEESIRAASDELNNIDRRLIVANGRVEEHLSYIKHDLAENGFNLPPADILVNAPYPTPEATSEESESEEESETTSKYWFRPDLFEVSSEDEKLYKEFIEKALESDGKGSLEMGENEKLSDVRVKLFNTGVKMQRRITLIDMSLSSRPKNLIPFEVSEILEHLSLENINLLRDNLSKPNALLSLPMELLETKINTFGLESRTSNALQRTRFEATSPLTVLETVSHDEEWFYRVRQFGEISFHDLLIGLVTNKVIPPV